MSSHEVNVLGFTERRGDHFTQRPDSTIGIIEVKPPISVGEKFGNVILGKDGYGISLTEVGSTATSTILISETDVMYSSTRYESDQAARQAQIQTVAERVLVFSNNPERSVELMQDNPFPEPRERW